MDKLQKLKDKIGHWPDTLVTPTGSDLTLDKILEARDLVNENDDGIHPDDFERNVKSLIDKSRHQS